MADDLRYVADQPSTLMVAATDPICRSGINEALLNKLQDVVGVLKEELRDSEVERRVLSKQNCIVVCEKAILEDHVATLEG